MVIVYVPAVVAVILLMVRVFALVVPRLPTLLVPEQPVQLPTLAVPTSMLPLASASYLVAVLVVFTTNVTVAVWLRLPLAPVMVTVYVPAAVVVAVAMVMPSEPEPPAIVVGLNFAVTPVGRPLTDIVTVPVNPFSGTAVAEKSV